MANKSLPLLSRLDSRDEKACKASTTGIGTNDGDWLRTHKQPPAIKLSKIFEPKINLTYYSFKIFPQF